MLTRIVRAVPPKVDALVDVANLTPPQVQEVYQRYRSPLLLSTKKTFHFLLGTGRLKRLPRGAHWMVLSVPDEKGEVAHFSNVKQSFSIRKLSSPVRLSYRRDPQTHASVCSVASPSGHTGYSHSFCELDDQVILRLSKRLRLPVVTNDRELGLHSRSSAPLAALPRPMRVLLAKTHVTVLVRGAGWKERSRHSKRRRSRGCAK